MLLRIIGTLCLLGLSQLAVGQSLDINLGDESAQFKYGSLVGGSTYGRTEMVLGLLYNDDKNYVAELGLQVVDVAGTKTPGLEIGAGAKFYYVDAGANEGAAIGIGGQLRYKFAQFPRIVFIGQLHFAPGIVSFGEVDSMIEYGFAIAYEILPTADIYVGLRTIKVEFSTGGDTTIDDTSMFGLKFDF